MRLGATFFGALLLLVAGGAVLGVLGWQGFIHEGKQRQQERADTLRRSLETAARNLKTWTMEFSGEPVATWEIVEDLEVATAGLSEALRLTLDQADFAAFREGNPSSALAMLNGALAQLDQTSGEHDRKRALLSLRLCRMYHLTDQRRECAAAAEKGLAIAKQEHRLDPSSTLIRPALYLYLWRSSDGSRKAQALTGLLKSTGHGRRVHTGTRTVSPSLA